MTRENLKNYIDDVESSKDMIEHLEELKTDIENITSKLNDMPNGSRTIQDKMAEKICQLQDEILQSLNEQIRLQKRRAKIISQLNLMQGKYKRILTMKYIQGRTLVEIAAEMKYDYDYIRKCHGIALCIFDNFNKEN